MDYEDSSKKSMYFSTIYIGQPRDSLDVHFTQKFTISLQNLSCTLPVNDNKLRFDFAQCNFNATALKTTCLSFEEPVWTKGVFSVLWPNAGGDFCAVSLAMFFTRRKSLRVLSPSYRTAMMNTTIIAPTISANNTNQTT